ncbi:sulfurtransferase [Aureimonas fodinaquatilis]|uniref:Sulfurtransferase n=1 Tax=Aureimonas fodinaquatilis TaxID=2565783 RepID=A0A5B0DYE8_9HYPH|nr:rhodanese-like domain-containing protein [Aureimonas fodinaquatilis]KAA0970885.1 sulfurtransferase [Aureimonas fodinaquatilis]
MTNQSPILEPEAFASWQHHHILDAREPAAFEAGHLPGAVPVSAKAWDQAAKATETGPANLDYWAKLIGGLGIDGSKTVVVIDDGKLTDAARIWFFLQHFGVDARVVDGGWPVLTKQELTVETGPASPPASATFQPEPAVYATYYDRAALADVLGDDVQIWDARTPAEYAGDDARRNPRPGRIPGAKLLNHVALTNSATGRLEQPDVLSKLLEDAGFLPGKPIIAYCEGGGRAALAVLVATSLGYPEPGAYYSSFADWSPDLSVPVER